MNTPRRLITLWLCLVALTVMLILPSGPALADDSALGRKLVTEFWLKVKAGELAALNSLLTEGFQSVHDFGAFDKAREMELFRGIKLGEYDLSGFKTTRSGDTLVVSYRVRVSHQEIVGRELPKTPTMRMSVFVKTGRGWQMAAHANLAPTGKTRK